MSSNRCQRTAAMQPEREWGVFHPAVVAGGLTAMALCLSGCGEGLGGGARATPSVRVMIDADAATPQGGAASPSAVQVAGYGTLQGKIVLKGSAPSVPPTIQQSQIKPDDKAVCIYDQISHHANLQVGPGGEFGDVFVYLPGTPPGARASEAPPEPVKFDQKTCMFTPHCLTALAGQTILVLNSDPILHNTHTFPQRNSPFNQGVKPNESVGVPLVYQRSEKTPVKVVCDIHPWMGAFQLPLDHPYAAVSSAEGTFTIADLPAGTHEFTIWHELGGALDSRYRVTIEPNVTTDVVVEIDPAKLVAFEGPRSRNVVLSVLP